MHCRYQVVTLEGIEALHNLRRLALCSGIDSLDPVAKLTQLEELVIQDTAISDLTPLAGLRNLKRLEIRGSQLSDLSPLSDLVRLETLVIANSQVSDLTPLKNLTRLKRLFLYQNQIESIQPLAGLQQLTILNLSNNRIVDLMPLANQQELLNLYLARNQVEDLRPLTTIPKLMGLDLRCNPAAENGQLQLLENLQWLDVRCTSIINPEVPEECQARCGQADEICLYVNGVCLEVDQPPIVEAGCTLLPISPVAKAMGAEIRWNSSEKAAEMIYGEQALTIPINADYARMNGRQIDLFYPTQLRNGRTMIHSRLLIDAFGVRIHFDAENRMVTIDSQ
ncbi:leucine-rich repeat domain-containing protein [Anoxynatronum sibiricum]|uniref:leucine-rich repeat domain-containing protein n=1 Tax=Anoxynatronum sibiricum TaxID=210623 RepID=UPI0031B86B9A